MGAAQNLLGKGCLFSSIILHKCESSMRPIHLLRNPHSSQRPVFLEQFFDIFFFSLECDVSDHQLAALLLFFLDLLLEFVDVLHVLNFLPGEREDQFVPIDQAIVQFLYCLDSFLVVFELDKTKTHGFSFLLHNSSVFDWCYLLKYLIELTLVSSKIQILDVNYFAQLLHFLLLFFCVFLLLLDGLFGDHPHRCVLQKQIVVFEFVVLKIFKSVVSKLAALEFDNCYGSVGCHHKFINQPVKLQQFFQF